MWCDSDNHSYMCTYEQKNLYIRTLIKQLFTKYQVLMKLSQILYIHKNRNFKSILGIF